MEWMYLAIVAFLFILAAFDLYVGVSNDAVNFLNSAIGSKSAKFKTLVVIAGIGVFCGACMSNGMMDIARHGILNPEQYYFKEVMLVFLAVMVTDVVLLDVFNSLGMPTSTTVSMVFELMGAGFAFTMIKWMDGGSEALSYYMNTSKALEIVISIFMSVAIAFVCGCIVQYLARIVFTFSFRNKSLKWKIGIYGGLAITAILYFMLFKGLKDLSFMTKDVKTFLNEHIGIILLCCFVVFSVVMQILHALKVNVFRVIVLVGTFALATAFAGNDLVNFIGVPLAGYSSFLDFSANHGALTPETFAMSSLQDSATTPVYFLIAAGAIMVFALATSKKAHNVVKTEVGLSSKDEGDEMFGSSKVARSIVRFSNNLASAVTQYTPSSVGRFIDSRFKAPSEAYDNGAAYDQVRASVNLMVASLLIALGTSLKLPLSTTYVTFMVAMGTSLADRAWSRESAVFRITGVLTVIGGWFVTAGVAFTACFFVAMAMNFGGIVVIVLIIVIAIYSLIHSQRVYAKKMAEEKEGDVLFNEILACKDKKAVIPMLRQHLGVSVGEMLTSFGNELTETTDGLFEERLRPLRRSAKFLNKDKRIIKTLRRRELIALRRTDAQDGIRLSTTFHLVHNSLRQLLYGLLRINEPARDHVDNHFTPIDEAHTERYCSLRNRLVNLINDIADDLKEQKFDSEGELQAGLSKLNDDISAFRDEILVELQTPGTNMTTETLLLHIVQETEQFANELSDLLKSAKHFNSLTR